MKMLIIKEYDSFKTIDSNNENLAIVEFSKKNFEKIKNVLTTPLSNSGIYILKSENENGSKKIYIGQTKNGFLNRIKDSNHFWQKNEIYSIIYIYSTSTSQPFNIDDLNFYESKFIELFNEKYKNDKCIVHNKTSGNENVYKNDSLYKYEKNIIFDAIVSLIELINKEYFLEFDFDDKFQVEKNLVNDENLIDVYPSKDKTKTFKFNTKTFKILIFKGTRINSNLKSKKGIDQFFNFLINLEKQEIVKNNAFIQDTWLSPSSAAKFIYGASINGWTYWTTKNDEKINIYR